MLPLLSRPMIDYVVDDVIAAGVTDIIFVVSEHNRQLFHYYRENERLRQYLIHHQKESLYQEVATLHQKANFHFITQNDSDAYGTAVPLKLAQPLLEQEEAFFVFMGDDFLYNTNGTSESNAMLQTMQTANATAVTTCVRKPKDQLERYGVIKTKMQGEFQLLESIVEKPKPEDAPSDLVNISKYILSNQVFDILKTQTPNPSSGELYITDTLTELAKLQPVAVHVPQGSYLDGGNPLEWLKANVTIGLQQPELAEPLRSFLKSAIS